MVMKYVGETSTSPLTCYETKVTSNSHPSQNGTVRNTYRYNQQVIRYVNKDITHRDWKSIIARGDNATTPLQAEDVRCIRSPGNAFISVTRVYPDSYGYYSTLDHAIDGDIAYALNVPGHSLGDSVAKADSKAKTTFVSRVNDKIQSYKGMTYLGEAGESIRMLRNNTETFAKKTNRYLIHVQEDLEGLKTRRSRLPKRYQRLGDLINAGQRIVTQRYLEYTYGIKPLMADTQAAAETLSKIHNYEDYGDFVMVSAVGRAPGLSYASSSGYQFPPLIKGTFNFETKTTTSVVYRGVVSTGLVGLMDVNKFLGFDYTDFLPTLWEILPWSFVIDYVTNISDIVDAASLARSRLRWVSKTVVHETERSTSAWTLDTTYPLTAFPTIYKRLNASSFTPPKLKWLKRSISRDTYTGSLIPDFTWQVPKPKQMINCLALLASIKSSQKFITTFLTK